MATYRLALTQPQYGNATLEPFGLWRSLVARSVRVGEVAGSNPVSPIPGPARIAPHAASQTAYGAIRVPAPTQSRRTTARCVGVREHPRMTDDQRAEWSYESSLPAEGRCSDLPPRRRRDKRWAMQ